MKQKDNRLRIILHVIIWAIIIFIPIYIFRITESNSLRPINHFFINMFFYALIFYINYLYLIPELLFKKNKKALFIISEIILVWILYIADCMASIELISRFERSRQFMEALPQGHFPHFSMGMFRIFNFSVTSILIIGFALGLCLTERHTEEEKQRKELEQAKLHSELAFLKNQISPHFFFNTLNNIYALTSIDTAAAQESILKLSKLMRYLLYESENEKTLMSQEIAFMNNYINLMALRLSPKIDLSVDFPEKYIDANVPPLLFISFIENAFKHGISNLDKSFIKIKMEIFDDGSIYFETRNTLGKSQQPSDSSHSGIGLENVKKRLDLLYPNQHELKMGIVDDIFEIKLKLESYKNQKNVIGRKK